MSTIKLEIPIDQAKQLRDLLNAGILGVKKYEVPINIFINGDRFLIPALKTITYKGICQSYFTTKQIFIYPFLDKNTGEPIENLTITYSNGPSENPQGLIKPDKDYVVKEHMHFHIVDTSKA